MRRKDEAHYGEFRTKRLVLEAYDAIAGRDDYEDLIPAEARERSKTSVIGKPSETKQSPVKLAAIKLPTAATQRAATAAAHPAPKTEKSAPTMPAPPAQKSQPAVEKPAAEEVTPPSDYGLYRCQGCGKRIMGFDKEDHVRRVHADKDPGFEKIR